MPFYQCLVHARSEGKNVAGLYATRGGFARSEGDAIRKAIALVERQYQQLHLKDCVVEECHRTSALRAITKPNRGAVFYDRTY
jgi:hypothetical protein